MDEAGISAQEPALVVASIIIHGDAQYNAVKHDLRKIVEKYISEKDRDGFVFHAMELFSGGKYFTREAWPREKRWEILKEILSLAPHHKIPVCLCFLSRDDFNKKSAEIGSQDELPERAHTVAFMSCVLTIDHWMRQYTEDENTILVVEDTNEKKSRMKKVFGTLSKASDMAEIPLNITPVSRIIDTPHFVKKSESSILQIADAWAFLLRRKLLEKPDVEYFSSVFDETEMFMKKFEDVLPEASS
jgi:hypothetical protein